MGYRTVVFLDILFWQMVAVAAFLTTLEPKEDIWLTILLVTTIFSTIVEAFGPNAFLAEFSKALMWGYHAYKQHYADFDDQGNWNGHPKPWKATSLHTPPICSSPFAPPHVQSMIEELRDSMVPPALTECLRQRLAADFSYVCSPLPVLESCLDSFRLEKHGLKGYAYEPRNQWQTAFYVWLVLPLFLGLPMYFLLHEGSHFRRTPTPSLLGWLQFRLPARSN